MKLHEVLAMRKPYKYPGMSRWITPHQDPLFSKDDVLRDDWEVKPEPREWTLMGVNNGYWIVDGPVLVGDLKKFKVREVVE